MHTRKLTYTSIPTGIPSEARVSSSRQTPTSTLHHLQTSKLQQKTLQIVIALVSVTGSIGSLSAFPLRYVMGAWKGRPKSVWFSKVDLTASQGGARTSFSMQMSCVQPRDYVA